jgi:hypothetical protein
MPTDNNIVYSRVDISLEFPRKFYLIPHDPYADSGSTAVYLAAFDGHKKADRNDRLFIGRKIIYFNTLNEPV